MNPDILHAVMESYAGVALWFSKYLVPGVKRILTLQSGDLDKKIWRNIPVLWKKIHTSPDLVTAISGFLANRARRLGAKNIEITPNGVDFGEVADVLVNKNYASASHRIICLARLSWEKDHKNLVAAMPEILKQYPDAEMIFAGDGPLRGEIEAQIKNLGLYGKIKLLGKLPHKSALEEVAKSDVSICPSLAEGLGITFIEAQALGVPVIGTNVGGIPDVIEDGKTGLLIQPGSKDAITGAVIKIFSMPAEEKAAMIEAEKSGAKKKFDWKNIADNIEKIYQSYSR
jgi:glycosyltransferase involved in cell wall biosynthesis